MKENIQSSSLQPSMSFLIAGPVHSFEAFSYPSVMIVTKTAASSMSLVSDLSFLTVLPMAS